MSCDDAPVPSELGGYGVDRPRESADQRQRGELSAAERAAWQEKYFQGLDEAWAEQREKNIAAAAERGLSREQWQQYEHLAQEDSWHAGKLEEARRRLREGPPNFEGVRRLPEEEKQEVRDSWRTQENEALERFRSEPVEGADNTPIDPERRRPRVEWCEGDPPIDPGDLTRRDVVLYQRPERRDHQNPRSGLGSPEAAPDPRLTPEQHQEKIDRQRGYAAEVMGAQAWSNSRYAGRMYDKLTPKMQERFPAGVEFSDEGFPQFDRYSSKTVVFDEGFRGPDREDDFKRANAIFGWKGEPKGMTWHHKEDGRTLILIDARLHQIGHWGGVRTAKQMGLWEQRAEERP